MKTTNEAEGVETFQLTGSLFFFFSFLLPLKNSIWCTMVSSSPYSSTSTAANHADGTSVAAVSCSKPDLEVLVGHLVAAKRSLSSIHHVWRANEIVTTARSSLEESVIISARTGFLRRGLNDQLRLLYGVRAEIEQVANRGRTEFDSTLKELDAVDAQLKQTLDVLQKTVVEPTFRPAGEQSKSLHDFVDERGVEDLQSLLKDAIDNTNAAQEELDQSNLSFDRDLQSVQQSLEKHRKLVKSLESSSSLSSSSRSQSHANNPPSLSVIPDLLHSLESHAQDMAGLLESLVKHFDLCVTAVKHTEGGGAAARSITGDLPTGVDVGVSLGKAIDGDDNNDSNDDDDKNANAPLEPLTENEYHEMINVLTKDASEADDVVLEIQDRITEMENTLEQVVQQCEALFSVSTSTTEIFHHLSNIASADLPNYIFQAQNFTNVWTEQHERMQLGMADLADLCSLYRGFLDAYDGLILEVTRRKAVRSAVEDLLGEARARLDELYEEDVRARESFRIEQGDFLPSDIWPGLGRGPMRVEFKRVEGPTMDPGAGAGAGTGAEAAPGSTTATAVAQEEPSDGNEEKENDKGTANDTPANGNGVQDGHVTDNNNDDGNVVDSIPDLPDRVVETAYTRLKQRRKK